MAAGDVFQCQIELAAVFVEIVDLDEIGMLAPGGGSGLAAEAGQMGRVVVSGFLEQLERDIATEGVVTGEVNDAHATAAEDALDVVAGDLRQPGAG